MEELRETFINLVTRLNQENGALPDWWLTWLSCRDRVRPRLWDRLVELAGRAATDGAAASSGESPSLPPFGTPASVRLWLSDAWTFAKHVRLAAWRIAAARRHPLRRASESADVIIVTILSERAVAREGRYEDVYFGRLHEWLVEAGQRVIYCGFPEAHPGRTAAAAAARDDVAVVTFGHLLSVGDFWRALVTALSSNFRIPPLPLPWGGDAEPLVRAEIRREKNSIFDGILIRRAMARLLAEHPRARVIHMYENNGWERASYQAAKTATPSRDVTGYLHCAVLRSHLKNVFPTDEPGLRPMPDRVVTNGPAATQSLRSLGDYPPGKIVDGCSLRLPLLTEMAALRAPRRPVRTVLAVFEGLISVVPAMQLFHAAARQRPGSRFLVRCHQQLPIERLAALAGVPFGPGEAVAVSSPASIEDAVTEADAVVYVSSTAVLYALYSGRPIIKIENDILDDDPLTACPTFKWHAASPDQLLKALDEIDAMPTERAAAAARAAREYLDGYMRPPSPETLAPFLEPRTSDASPDRLMKNTRLAFPNSKAFSQALERVVPGGTHTYSKGRDQFPQEAPNGITHGKGARVWDADGNCLIDWSMGLTSVSLGHADPVVNAAVHAEIDRGVNFQRPAAIELKAAETFLALAGTDMVKFAKHGSVVNTAAVKLARGYTGRAKVAVPSEHPFFSFDDWFIGATAADFGIPDELKRFTVQFRYNDFSSVEALFRAHGNDLACVMLEPVKFDPPEQDFLHRLRDLCARNRAVLILDEMVTGLKFDVPGAARHFGVDADLYTYGKGISNGYAAAALTGKGDIMRLGGLEPEGARKLFLLSTTHGAESSGLAAMIATLAIFRDGSLVKENWRKGERLRERLDAVTARYGLAGHIAVKGYPCLMAAEFLDKTGRPDASLRTLFMQEMIASGVLFQGLFVMTPSHGEDELAETETAWHRACLAYAEAFADGAVDGRLIARRSSRCSGGICKMFVAL